MSEFYRGKRVLITGGLGFIGSNLALRLTELGARVLLVDPMTDLDINCRSQLSLLECCRYGNPAVKIVFASTRQIYGRPRYLPVDERHPLVPVDINGVNKLAAEMYYALYHHLFVIQMPDRQRAVSAFQRESIGYGIHYPVPVHLMEAYGFLGYHEGELPVTEQASKAVLSLPLYPGLETGAVDRVIETLRGVR